MHFTLDWKGKTGKIDSMENLTIRPALKGDKESVDSFSKRIWDDDYLGRQFDFWLRDGNFFVAETEGKTVGCAKISILPGKTGWLEGLRVDPDYQKMGIGRAFNGFMIERITEMLEKRTIASIEYSTYYKNEESLHMGAKAGFEIQEKFICLYAEKNGESRPIESFIASKVWFNDYNGYIPAGWKFIKNSPEASPFILKNCEIYKNNEIEFYCYRKERTFCFFEKSIGNIISSLPFMRFLARVEVEIMIPASWSDILPSLYEAGFGYWHEPHEPNVYVLRNTKIKSS